MISSLGYVGYLKWGGNNYSSNIFSDVSSERDVVINKDELKCKDCNLIMISMSNVSAEHMSLYGYQRMTTPNLDKWAKDAVVFENAFTQSSWTLPVGVSLFTSLYPYAHGIIDRHTNNVLDEAVETLPEILRDHGYKTAAFTGGLDYSRSFGHMRGFDEVVEEGRDVSWPTDFAGFRDTFIKSESWIKKNQQNKFFIFLHGYDTHCPFLPPQEFKGTFSSSDYKNINIDSSLCLRGYRNNDTGQYEAYYFKDDQQKVVLTQNDINYLKDSYDEEILSVDSLLVDFLHGLDKSILNKTIIVIFSDHGEMFAKHGRFGRAGAIRGTLYDDVLHVPLIMKIPGSSGERIIGLSQLIDVAPTIINFLDISGGDRFVGNNLAPLISGQKESVNNFVFAGTKFGVGLRNFVYTEDSINEAIRNEKYKLIHEIIFDEQNKERIKKEIYELYDMENDPDELNDLTKKEKGIFDNLKFEMEKVSNSAKSIDLNAKTQELPENFMEEAKKRGYW